MTDVTISELRANLPDYIRMVNRKGTIRITSRGREVARLVAARSPKEEARTQLAELRKTAKVGEILSPVLTDWNALT